MRTAQNPNAGIAGSYTSFGQSVEPSRHDTLGIVAA